MKTDIHPEYVECRVHCSCGNEFVTRSTVVRAARRALLGVPPLLHGQAEARRHRWPGRALPAPGREGQDQEGVARHVPGRAPLHGRTGGARGRDDARRVHLGGRGPRSRRRRSRSTCARCPGWAERYRNIPVVRGVMGLGESLGLGYRALTWSANQQVPEEEQVSEKVMGWAVARRGRSCSARCSSCCPRSPAVRSATCSTVRSRSSKASPGSRIFVVYLLAISRRPRHPARLPVPRRRAQGDRRVRERRRAHARDRAAVLDRARAVRHELPADGDGRRDPRVLGDPAARTCSSSSGRGSCSIPVIAGLSYEVIRLVGEATCTARSCGR